MTLGELMDEFFDETWFKIEDINGDVHFIWNADRIGGDEDTLRELEPLEQCETDSDSMLKMCANPEGGSKVPMVCVTLMDPVSDMGTDEMDMFG